MEKTRRNFSPEQKVSILKEHLVERVAISDLCERNQIQPAQFYQWQKAFFENGALAFESQRPHRALQSKAEAKVQALESKLQMREEALAELMVEHVRLKKDLGEI